MINNSAKNITDEWAIDAFNNGLRRADFIEELGRARSRTVGELMDLATNRLSAKTEPATNDQDHPKRIGQGVETITGDGP
jgi:hypothetical protein